MARYECSVCGHVYDEEKEGRAWDSLPESWTCPVCDSAKSYFAPKAEAGSEGSIDGTPELAPGEYLAEWKRPSDDLEIQAFARLTGNDDVHNLAITDLCTTNSEILQHSDIAHA